MTIFLLPDRLCLLRFPREDLELCSHAILKHVMFRDYSHSNHKQPQEPLFSYIDNSLEISIFGDAEAMSKDFKKEVCPRLEISTHIYRAIQVDNDDTFNSSRICTIVEPLAKAGVSVFYMSTYQTDLLFVQEDRLPIVFRTLSKYGLQLTSDQDLNSTPPHTPIPHQDRFWIDGEDNDDNLSDVENDTRYPSSHSLATPPGSNGSSSGDEEEEVESKHAEGEESTESLHATITKQLLPLDITSAQQHGKKITDGTDDSNHTKASPTTTTAFELRQQAVRTVPQNTLRCVGLNTDLEGDHQPWILKVIKILFYNEKVKEQAILDGKGPRHDAPRFFSFTATSECVSMITDTYILEEFEEHELFMDMETCPLRLIQLDLQRFGLDKFGIIHSVARLLTEAGIELLYLSTFSTANILVAEHQLSDAERILSGSGTSTPSGEDSDNEGENEENEETS